MLELVIEDSGRGEPVVFVHGSWGDLHSWDALVAELPGYRLIRYSRRGHSGSECPPGQGLIEEDVGDLAAIAEAVGSAHLVGNSLGAEIALRSAIATELVRSLALHEPGFWSLAPDDPAVRAIRAGLVSAIELLEDGAVEAGTREFAAWVFGPGAWEEAVPDALKQVMLANALTFLDEERAPDNGIVDATRLPEVSAPVLLSTGEESHPAFHVVTDRLAAALPHAERERRSRAPGTSRTARTRASTRSCCGASGRLIHAPHARRPVLPAGAGVPAPQGEPDDQPQQPPGGGDGECDHERSHDHEQDHDPNGNGQHAGAGRHRGPLTRHRATGQVPDQPVELAVGARPQRGVKPLLQLVRLEPALDSRLPEALGDRVAVGVRRPERGGSGHHPKPYRVSRSAMRSKNLPQLAPAAWTCSSGIGPRCSNRISVRPSPRSTNSTVMRW